MVSHSMIRNINVPISILHKENHTISKQHFIMNKGTGRSNQYVPSQTVENALKALKEEVDKRMTIVRRYADLYLDKENPRDLDAMSGRHLSF